MTAPAPTPEAVAGCLEVFELGGDPARLAAVLQHQANHYQGVARQRLVNGAEAMRWTAELLAALEAQEGDGNEAA